MIAGRPKFPAKVVINLVLNLGSFLPYQKPIPIIRKNLSKRKKRGLCWSTRENR